MANEKELKITTVLSSKGGDAATRDVENLRKAFESISRALKDTQRAMDAFVNGTKQATKETQGLNEALKAQATYIQNVEGAQRRSGSVMGRGGGGGYYMGNGGTASGNGADYNGPVSQPPKGFNWGNLGKGFGIAGAALGVAAGAYNTYNQYEQHRAQREITEKTLGIENLARSSSYKNSVFFESRSAPQGYQALKDYTRFAVKSSDSDRVSVDSNGQITGSGGGLKTVLGRDMVANSVNMAPEKRLMESQANGKLWGGLLSGGAMAAGGLGGIIGGGAMITAGMAASATGVGALAGVPAMAGGVGVGAAGAAGLYSGLKTVVDAIWSTHNEDKKLREGELEAKSNEEATKTSAAMDDVLAIKRYQMGAFQGAAGGMLGAGQSALNAGAWESSMSQGLLDPGAYTSLMGSVNRGFGSGGKGAFGSAYRAAGEHGMGLGAAANISGTFATLSGDKQALERIMAAGVRNGMGSLDMGFFEKFGMAAAKAGYSGASGAMNPGVAAASLMGGRGTPNTFEVNERIQGLGLASSMFQENPYLRSRGMVSAAHILGNGATGGKVGALAGADWSALAGGQGSDKLRAYGVSGEQMQAAANARLQAIADVDLNSSDLNAGSRQGIRANGMPAYLQNLRQRLNQKDKNGKPTPAAMAARKELDNLSAVTGDNFGEEFGGVRGMMEVTGASPSEIAAWGGKVGKLPGGVANGAAARNRADSNKTMLEDVRAGREINQDLGKANDILNDSAFAATNEGMGLKGKMMKAHGNKKQQELVAQEIMDRYGAFKGDQAAGKSGYGSAQEVAGQFESLSKQAQQLVGDMDALSKVIGKITGIPRNRPTVLAGGIPK